MFVLKLLIFMVAVISLLEKTVTSRKVQNVSPVFGSIFYSKIVLPKQCSSNFPRVDCLLESSRIWS